LPDVLVVSTCARTHLPDADRLKQFNRFILAVALVFGALASGNCKNGQGESIRPIDPPGQGFYSKQIDYRGIPIKASSEVADEALYAARGRLEMVLSNQPVVIANLGTAGAELHIIGRDQVTSDLPEHQHLKEKKLEQYHGLTVDERTRGLGGLLTSCGEENLLKLEKDRYKGRDICVHEFAHNIRQHGIPRDIRKRFDDQYRKSLEKGLWQKSYAASNPDEFFAELTMWYFGTHGDLHMTGTKPENGRGGLKKYDPESFELLEEFYSGRMQVPKIEPKRSRLTIEN
jgi:alpha-glucosidase